MSASGSGLTVTAVVNTLDLGRPDHSLVASPGQHCPCRRGRAWDDLHATFEMKLIDPSGSLYSKDGACTNQAWKAISPGDLADARRLVSTTTSPGLISASMLGEMAWREDMRRSASRNPIPCMWPLGPGRPPSPAWAGYWQRHRRREESSSSRLIGDPPEDAVTCAIRRFVQSTSPACAVQRRPLTCRWHAGEAGAIGWVQPGVDHRGPDDVWCADRRTRPTKRIEHTVIATNLLVRTRKSD